MSNGLGDSIANVAEFFKLDRVADAVAKLAGASGCGCKERKEYLNMLFPYAGYKRSFIVEKTFIIQNARYTEGSVLDITVEHPLFNGVIALVKDNYIKEV
jgi:hypothetical protein